MGGSASVVKARLKAEYGNAIYAWEWSDELRDAVIASITKTYESVLATTASPEEAYGALKIAYLNAKQKHAASQNVQLSRQLSSEGHARLKAISDAPIPVHSVPPLVSRAAFIIWAVGSSRNRANWQLTIVKRARNVMRLITRFIDGPVDAWRAWARQKGVLVTARDEDRYMILRGKKSLNAGVMMLDVGGWESLSLTFKFVEPKSVVAQEAAGGRKFDCEMWRKEVWDPTDCPTDWKGELIVKFSERMADVRRLIELNGFTFKVDHKDKDPNFHFPQENKTITIFGNGHAMSFSFDFWKIIKY